MGSSEKKIADETSQKHPSYAYNHSAIHLDTNKLRFFLTIPGAIKPRQTSDGHILLTDNLIGLIAKKEQGQPDLLTKALLSKDVDIDMIRSLRSAEPFEKIIEQWNLGLREVSAGEILKNWEIYREVSMISEAEMQEALKIVEEYKDSYKQDGPSLRSCFAYIRQQYGKKNLKPPVELTQAILTIVEGLDLPALLTETLRNAINNSKDSNEVVNLVEAWKGVEDPWTIAEPRVEEFALDLIKRSNFLDFANNPQATFRSFCLMLQELSLASVNPMSAWSKLSQEDAQNIINYMAKGKNGDVMTKELLLLLDHGYIISPYQFLYLKKQLLRMTELTDSTFYSLLEKNYNNDDLFGAEYYIRKPSKLFEMAVKNSYSITSEDRAKEFKRFSVLLSGIDKEGVAVDIGSSLPLCLLERCVNWKGPVISIDSKPINDNSLKEIVCFNKEFLPGGDELSLKEKKLLYDKKRIMVPQHHHFVATLPADLEGFLYKLDQGGKPISLLQDQAFTELYSGRQDRLLVRKALLSRLSKNGYAIFTRRFSAMPYRLNDIVIGRKLDGSFFVRMIEEKTKRPINKKKESKFYDRRVQVYQPDGHEVNYLPSSIDNTVYEKIESSWSDLCRRLKINWPNNEDIYVIDAYLNFMSQYIGNEVLDLRRSIQGPSLLPIPFNDFPMVVSNERTSKNNRQPLNREYDWLLNSLDSIDNTREMTDRLHLSFEESMKKRGFNLFNSSSLIYPPDENMYVLSLGRAEIEAKLIELITGTREGKLLRDLLHGEQERMAGFQICLRHRDIQEVKGEMANPAQLSKHARLFTMYGYFLIQEKNKISHSEMISPVWDFFIKAGLKPSNFWVVIHPKESKIREMLISIGIPKNQITLNAKACNWRQGGSKNEALGGNLKGRNFELFYQLRDGQKIELLNVINIKQVEGKKPFEFDVWEVAFGWERLKMAVISEKTNRQVSIYELEEKKGLVDELNMVVSRSIPNRKNLILQLADAYSAAFFLTQDISSIEHQKIESWKPEDYLLVAKEVLEKESHTPRYRRIGQPLMTEVQVLSRQLGLNQNQIHKLYIFFTNSLTHKHLIRSNSNVQVVTEIFLLEAERLDKLLFEVFKKPDGPLYLTLRQKDSQQWLKKNADVYREEMRLRFGLPKDLFEPIIKICQQIVSKKIDSVDILKDSLRRNLGMENATTEEIEHILSSVHNEELRLQKKSYKPPLAIQPSSIVIKSTGFAPKSFHGKITDSVEGEPIVDMRKIFEQAAKKLAPQLPEIIKAIKQEVTIIGIGNDSPEADSTPHNMGSNVVKVLELAFQKIIGTDKNLIHLLRNYSDMNFAGQSLLKTIKENHLENAKALVVTDDARAHLGSWTPDFGRINEKEPHKGLKSIYDFLGKLPTVRVGTFTSDQRGPPKNNVLRRYNIDHETELAEALVLYAKRVLLSLS